jgi:hypothetical protein
MPDAVQRWGAMRHDRIRAGLLLLAAMLVTSACGEPPQVPPVGLTGGWETAGCSFTRPPVTMTVGGRTLPATPPSLDAAMARIERGGRDDYPDSYAGLEVDQQRVRAVVYRVPSADFDNFIRLSAEDTCVVVRDSLHGLRELNQWHDRVVADLDMWAARGIRIVTVGARHDGFGVEVGTRDVERARAELPARYGEQAPLIFIEQGPVTPLAQPGPPKAVQPGG